MNEIVKYHNDLNQVSFGNLNEYQLNIIFTILSKIKDKGVVLIEFDIDEIVKLAGIGKKDTRYLITSLFSTFNTIQNLKFQYINKDNNPTQAIAFPKIVIDRKNKKLKVNIFEDFAYIFNNLVGNFTRFELSEFISVSGKYSKTLYRLLKQYKNTGYFKIEWDKFINLLDVPKSYELRDIDRQILKPAIKELSKYFKNLKYEKIKDPKGRGRGGKVVGIEFKFTPQNYEEFEKIYPDYNNLLNRHFIFEEQEFLIHKAPTIKNNKLQIFYKNINTSEEKETIIINETHYKSFKKYLIPTEEEKIKQKQQLNQINNLIKKIANSKKIN